MMPNISRRAFAATVLAAGAVPRARAQARPLVVASKLDTEGALLGNLIAISLRAAGLPVTERLQLGPTRIVRQALLAGEIDIYPEYTGNGAFFFQIAEDPVWKDAAAAFARVRDLDRDRNDLVWLEAAPANNTWAIAVRADLARQANLRSLEDLARHVNGGGPLRLAASSEFVESPAALPAFQAAYGFRLPPERLLVLPGGDTAVTMRAAAERLNGVNAAMVYGTDGAIEALELVVLADTKAVQPVYAPAPVVRGAIARANPALAGALAPVFRTLDDATLRQLNMRIVVEGRPPAEVARAHLTAARLPA